jgi:large subunit ribosomal protein L5
VQTLSGDAQLSEEVEKSAKQNASAAGEKALAQASEAKPKRVRKPAGLADDGSGAGKPARAAGNRAKPAATESKSLKGAAAVDSAPAAPKRFKDAVVAKAAPRLQLRYDGEIRGQLFTEFGYKSRMQVPGVKKIVINVGLGEALTNAKALETTPAQIGAITGQKPVITKARKSIAGFKLREQQAIGVMVTLRGRRMYEFLDRLISMALPRIRDFRGVSRTAFDGNGNYSLGLREQIMFPEIDYASIDRVRGMQVVITTSARSDPEGFRLLELMGMPFAREGQKR